MKASDIKNAINDLQVVCMTKPLTAGALADARVNLIATIRCAIVDATNPCDAQSLLRDFDKVFEHLPEKR